MSKTNHVEACFHAAVKAGAYIQAVELLKALRTGKASAEDALIIRLTKGWDWK